VENFLVVARQVAIFYLLIGAGVACCRFRLIEDVALRSLVNILVVLVTPAVVIDSFHRPFDLTMLHQLGLAVVVATAAHLVGIAIAYLAFRGDERTLPVLRDATVFSNVGFMGIPLEYALLGPTGVFYGTVYLAVFNVFVWSWGLRQMRKGGSDGACVWRQLAQMFVNPGTIGIVLGVPLFLFSVTLPEVIGTPVRMLSNLNTPLAMLVIGFYLGKADLRSFLRIPAVHAVAFVRLVAFPLIVLGGLWVFRSYLDRTMALAAVTAASAPVAAIVTMFSAKYGRAVDMSVGLVSGTTVLSTVTMPIVIAFAMKVL